MSNYFEQNLDKNRLKTILDIKLRHAHKELSLEDAKKELKEKIGKITPLEIAGVEQELLEFEHEQCQKEDIQAMTRVFEDIMDTSRPQLPDNHPIDNYYRENDYLRKIIKEIQDLVQYPVIKNQWYEIYDKLDKIKIHYSRKQNQLYSVLEKKGFTRPTTTMWTLDDYVRDEINSTRNLLEKDQDEFIKMQDVLIADILDLVEKEEKILYPTSLAMITKEEFEDMKIGDEEIGFAWITVDKLEHKQDTPKIENGFVQELNSLLSKYSMVADTNQLDVKTGKLSLEQINLIYQHMPVDLSFVDENEIVKFYTDTEHRVFPRSKNVIGRDVKNCHPRNSVHIVQEIIEKFRTGEQSEAEFWINKPELFIYIKYIAVRDKAGKFRGVLEMMQDCTHIRGLQGSQTLLNWSENKEPNQEDEPNIQDTNQEIKNNNQSNTKEQDKIQKVDENTRLQDLLNQYPNLKKELPNINSAFKMLNTPLAKVLIPKATVKIMSERSGMDINQLIEKLNQYIKNN